MVRLGGQIEWTNEKRMSEDMLKEKCVIVYKKRCKQLFFLK